MPLLTSVFWVVPSFQPRSLHLGCAAKPGPHPTPGRAYSPSVLAESKIQQVPFEYLPDELFDVQIIKSTKPLLNSCIIN